MGAKDKQSDRRTKGIETPDTKAAFIRHIAQHSDIFPVIGALFALQLLIRKQMIQQVVRDDTACRVTEDGQRKILISIFVQFLDRIGDVAKNMFAQVKLSIRGYVIEQVRYAEE